MKYPGGGDILRREREAEEHQDTRTCAKEVVLDI